MRRTMPRVLWAGLVSLALLIALNIYQAVQGSVWLLLVAAFAVVLLVGLYKGTRWAFVLTLVYVIFSTAVTRYQWPSFRIGVFVLDTLVVLPVLLSFGYFFPRSRPRAAGAEQAQD